MSSNRVASTATAGGATVAIPIRKVGKEDFRGATPKNQPLVQIYMVLPSDKSPLYIDPSDMVVKKALDKIKDKCEVWIEVDDDSDTLLISGRTLEKVGNGMREVQHWQRAQATELEGTATILVHRIGGAKSYIKLEDIRTVAGARFVLPDGSWRGVALSGGKAEEVEVFDAVPQFLAKDLFEAYKQAARTVRPDLGHKYVRVHLGLRTMSRKKRAETVGLEGTLSKKKSSEAFDPEARDKYSTSQFQTLLNSATKRGHSAFHLCFGGENLTQTILQHIYETDDPELSDFKRYVARDATVDRLEDVKPQFCLIFFSAGFRIEMDIHFEMMRRPATTSTSRSLPTIMNKPTASSPRVFRYNKTVDAEVVVACPDMKIDWQISVESDLSADKVHDKYRELATSLRFDPVPEGTLTFPVGTVSRQALLRANIDGAACKVYRTVECVNAPYLVEIAAYYDWNSTPLAKALTNPGRDNYTFDTAGQRSPAPSKSCAVALYDEDWDAKMRNTNPTSGPFAEELIDIFYNRDQLAGCGSQIAGELSAGQLLREVEFLLDITTQAATELESLENDTQHSNNPASVPAGDATQAVSGPEVPTQEATEAESLLDFGAQPEDTESLLDFNDHQAEVESLIDVRSHAETESLLDFSAQPDAR